MCVKRFVRFLVSKLLTCSLLQQMHLKLSTLKNGGDDDWYWKSWLGFKERSGKKFQFQRSGRRNSEAHKKPCIHLRRVRNIS